MIFEHNNNNNNFVSSNEQRSTYIDSRINLPRPDQRNEELIRPRITLCIYMKKTKIPL